MPVCAVNTCRISSLEAVKRDGVISFHCFPKEKKMRARWLRFCGLANDPGKSLYVCSQHFSSDLFTNNASIQNMVMPHCGARNRLVKYAYPSIRKPSAPDTDCCARAARYQRKERKSTVAALLEAYEKHHPVEEQPRKACPQNEESESPESPIREPKITPFFSLDCKEKQPSEIPIHCQDKLETTPVLSPRLPPHCEPQRICLRNRKNQPSDYSIQVPAILQSFTPFSSDCGLEFSPTSSNMDVLFAAIELSEVHQTANAKKLGVINDRPIMSGTSCELNRSTLFDPTDLTRMQGEQASNAPADSINDFEWVDFEGDFMQESACTEDCPTSCSLKSSHLEKLTNQVKRLKDTVHSKNEIIKMLRVRIIKNNKHFVALLKTLKEKNKQLKQKDEQLAEKSRTVDDLRKACDQLNEIREKNIMDRVEEVLKGVFTRNQIDLILKKKKKVIWTAEEIAKSFSLRYHSKPAYELLRTEFSYPLPSLRCLREWASHINMRKGVLEDVFTLLKIAGSRMTEREKISVLVYDEMSVQSTSEYDKKNDEVIGPHSEMQVVMARGLFAQWKQPIFVDFDVQVTKQLLDDLITRLHNIGFTVMANVHDCGTGNRGVWRDCGVNYESKQTTMKHPCTGKDIFFFPDAPHLYKLFRNWLLDHGFLYKGKLVTKKFLELLVQKASTLKRPFAENGEESSIEFNSLFKLTSKHLTVQGSERQNVRLAAELLSHTTVVNLRRHYGQYGEACMLAEIIEIVNNWFDVMNSYSLNQNVPSKKCYGVELEQQNQILDKMETLVKEIRVLSKHCLPAESGLKLFQKSILISIESTKRLLIEIRKIPGLEQSFLMMYKVNQDCAENQFALVRLNGGTHDHPTPLQALERIRLMILGKGLSRQLKVNQNTQSILMEEGYLISKVFRQVNLYLRNKDEDEEQSSDEEELPWVYEPRMRNLEEADGYEYAMGYIAKSQINKHPNLGSYTYQLEQDCEPEMNKENYVEDLSHGGLVQPSNEWLEIGDQLDSCFNWIHNTGPDGDQIGFRNKQNVNKRTFRKLKKKFPHLPDHVLKRFAKTRVSIRVRHLKKQLQEKKVQKVKNRMIKKREKKCAIIGIANVDERSAIVRKNSRKLKHFIN